LAGLRSKDLQFKEETVAPVTKQSYMVIEAVGFQANQLNKHNK